jgi:NifU-like protein involved in Fe-S cluster formation
MLMDEAIVKKYRALLTQDFPNSGQIDQPSIFVEAVGERLINCGNTGNYMQLFMRISKDRIVEIKYLCSCEPVANVAVEVMCDLVRGKTLAEAENIPESAFYETLGTRNEKLSLKVHGLIELLNEGVERFLHPVEINIDQRSSGKEKRSKTSWDGTLST